MLNILAKEKSNNNVNEQSLEEDWFSAEEEGQLAVDVFQKKNNLVVKATIAGAKAEDLEISVQNEMLIIKGKREMDEEVDYKDYLYRECYWGQFSRSIILPARIQEDKIKADLKDGVLTIVLPLVKENSRIIKIKKK